MSPAAICNPPDGRTAAAGRTRQHFRPAIAVEIARRDVHAIAQRIGIDKLIEHGRTIEPEPANPRPATDARTDENLRPAVAVKVPRRYIHAAAERVFVSEKVAEDAVCLAVDYADARPAAEAGRCDQIRDAIGIHVRHGTANAAGVARFENEPLADHHGIPAVHLHRRIPADIRADRKPRRRKFRLPERCDEPRIGERRRPAGFEMFEV
jgi:hypothetical protein